MNIDGIIFDVDGTFWDSTVVVEKAWNKGLADAGFEGISVSADQLKGLFGLPMDDILNAILPEKVRTEEAKKALCPFIYSYEENQLRATPPEPYEGLAEMIKTLHKKVPLFVVSNCQSGYIEMFCEKTGLGEYFTDHLCPGDTNKLKADNIRTIIEKYELKSPIYVGDTQMDADASRAANCPFVFCRYGFGNVPDAEFAIDKPMDLVELFESEGKECLCY